MARIAKQRYAGGRLSKRWYIFYTDASGRRRKKVGSTELKDTQILAGKIERREERIRMGIIDHGEGEGGLRLVDAEDEFGTYLEAKGNTAQHVREVKRYLRKIADAAGWVIISDMRAVDVERYLSKRLRPVDESAKALSFDGYNHYRSALISFGNWLVKRRRALAANPFVGISRRNPEENPVHPRRTLSTKEFVNFLATTRDGPERFGLPGRDREMLYLVASCSGLRASALAGLTPQRFDLDGAPAVLYATASLQKNRKNHAIPLPSFIVERLREWLARRVGLLWPGPWARWYSSEMVYRDLRAAGIEEKTAAGWFDFHALRHQYATMLVESGATPAEVQQLLDHSTPTLTARYFRHLSTERLSVPVERLPKLG